VECGSIQDGFSLDECVREAHGLERTTREMNTDEESQAEVPAKNSSDATDSSEARILEKVELGCPCGDMISNATYIGLPSVQKHESKLWKAKIYEDFMIEGLEQDRIPREATTYEECKSEEIQHELKRTPREVAAHVECSSDKSEPALEHTSCVAQNYEEYKIQDVEHTSWKTTISEEFVKDKPEVEHTAWGMNINRDHTPQQVRLEVERTALELERMTWEKTTDEKCVPEKTLLGLKNLSGKMTASEECISNVLDLEGAASEVSLLQEIQLDLERVSREAINNEESDLKEVYLEVERTLQEAITNVEHTLWTTNEDCKREERELKHPSHNTTTHEEFFQEGLIFKCTTWEPEKNKVFIHKEPERVGTHFDRANNEEYSCELHELDHTPCEMATHQERVPERKSLERTIREDNANSVFEKLEVQQSSRNKPNEAADDNDITVSLLDIGEFLAFKRIVIET